MASLRYRFDAAALRTVAAALTMDNCVVLAVLPTNVERSKTAAAQSTLETVKGGSDNRKLFDIFSEPIPLAALRVRVATGFVPPLTKRNLATVVFPKESPVIVLPHENPPRSFRNVTTSQPTLIRSDWGRRLWLQQRYNGNDYPTAVTTYCTVRGPSKHRYSQPPFLDLLHMQKYINKALVAAGVNYALGVNGFGVAFESPGTLTFSLNACPEFQRVFLPVMLDIVRHPSYRLDAFEAISDYGDENGIFHSNPFDLFRKVFKSFDSSFERNAHAKVDDKEREAMFAETLEEHNTWVASSDVYDGWFAHSVSRSAHAQFHAHAKYCLRRLTGSFPATSTSIASSRATPTRTRRRRTLIPLCRRSWQTAARASASIRR
jgi:hypothetical protein